MISEPFESKILPDRDYVKRSESVERTWTWMNTGELKLSNGKEQITLKLLNPAKDDTAIIRGIRLTRM